MQNTIQCYLWQPTRPNKQCYFLVKTSDHIVKCEKPNQPDVSDASAMPVLVRMGDSSLSCSSSRASSSSNVSCHPYTPPMIDLSNEDDDDMGSDSSNQPAAGMVPTASSPLSGTGMLPTTSADNTNEISSNLTQRNGMPSTRDFIRLVVVAQLDEVVVSWLGWISAAVRVRFPAARFLLIFVERLLFIGMLTWHVCTVCHEHRTLSSTLKKFKL